DDTRRCVAAPRTFLVLPGEKGRSEMSEFWNKVRTLEGTTMRTLHRRKNFTIVEVSREGVRVLPEDGKGKERLVPRNQIEHLGSMKVGRDQLRSAAAAEYPKSQNTSYIAAIVSVASQ